MATQRQETEKANPTGGATEIGSLLIAGDVLAETDLVPDGQGRWVPVHPSVVGTTLGQTPGTYLRPCGRYAG